MGKYISVEKQLVRLYRLGLDNEEVIKQFLLTACVEDVEKVRHGHWEFIGGYGYQYRCSSCIMCVPHKTKYCPHCGAKMDEVENEVN